MLEPILSPTPLKPAALAKIVSNETEIGHGAYPAGLKDFMNTPKTAECMSEASRYAVTYLRGPEMVQDVTEHGVSASNAVVLPGVSAVSATKWLART
ncbi:hypothetical protein [Variovorax sp. AFSI2.2]|uniref:hypothetical protein n=1 Tax=Variovorax sp. AFSI2.2 TaxID=3384160 RepID=UPI003EBF15CA